MNIEPTDGGIHEVVVTGCPDAGYDGTAFFLEPVSLKVYAPVSADI